MGCTSCWSVLTVSHWPVLLDVVLIIQNLIVSHCLDVLLIFGKIWHVVVRTTWSKSTAQTAHRVSLPLHKTPWHPHYSSAASFQAVAWKSMLQALASQGWNFLYKWKPIWNKNRPLCITTSIVHARKPIKFCFYLQCLLHSPVRWHCKLSLSPFKREL